MAISLPIPGLNKKGQALQARKGFKTSMLIKYIALCIVPVQVNIGRLRLVFFAMC